VAVRRPTTEQVSDLNQRLGLGLTAEEVHVFRTLVDHALSAHDWVQEVATTPAGTSRPGRPPSAAENELGAWYWRTDIRERQTGPLAGKTVAVKDNIPVAGVPMMNGSAVLEGYVPDEDATVVRRVLEAGAIVAGKAVCESLCFSGGSHTSDTGPVRNPYDPTRSSGGSTSGCAALLASRAVDLALGGDQGGSIRAPSSWSGVYGLKPTYGLVPYTGAFPLEMTLDHLGPMAQSSRDVALLLDVIAGPDGLDPRQNLTPPQERPVSYLACLDEGIEGLRVGVLTEGFEWEKVSEPDVDAAVNTAAGALGELGASVSNVSVPWHRVGRNVSFGIAAEGSTTLLMHGGGLGTNWKGLYPAGMLKAYARGLRERRELLPPMVKLQSLVGQWLHDNYDGLYYAHAQNLARRLTNTYDEVFAEVDVLVLPTLPAKAMPLPSPDISAAQSIHVSHQMGANTAPFNVTGHPAINVPCAMSEGLPVGMMIVGRRGDDGTVLRVSHSYERAIFRPPPPPDSLRSD
jgi:amidase